MTIGNSIPLATRDRQLIANELDNAFEPKIREVKDKAARRYRLPTGAKRVRGLDPTYNCVGFIFASARVFVPVSEVSTILDGDDYYSINPKQVRAGDVVTWSTDKGFEHVGLVVDVKDAFGVPQPTILSKWNALGTFLHAPNSVPTDFGTKIAYWRVRYDRKLV